MVYLEYTPAEENQDKKHEFYPMETTASIRCFHKANVTGIVKYQIWLIPEVAYAYSYNTHIKQSIVSKLNHKTEYELKLYIGANLNISHS